MKEKDKEYYEKTKDKKIICDCGAQVKLRGIAKHKRTQKHQNFINPSQ
jgi:hypothetical protein